MSAWIAQYQNTNSINKKPLISRAKEKKSCGYLLEKSIQ